MSNSPCTTSDALPRGSLGSRLLCENRILSSLRREENIVYIDEAGDLAIFLCGGPVLVTCSRTLCRVSSVLASHISASSERCTTILGVTKELQFDVPADHEGLIGAICVLMLIIHCRLKHDLISLAPDQIICLVQSANLWQMAGVLVPFAKAWTRKLERHLQETYPENYLEDDRNLWRQNPAVWALVDAILSLGCPAPSQRVLDIAFRQCVLIDADILDSEHDEAKESVCGMLRQLTRHIARRRTAKIHRYFLEIDWQIGQLSKAHGRSACVALGHEGQLCDCLLLGALTKGCEAANIYPPQLRESFNGSIAELSCKVDLVRQNVERLLTDRMDTRKEANSISNGPMLLAVHESCVDTMLNYLRNLVSAMRSGGFPMQHCAEVKDIFRQQSRLMGIS